MGARSPTYLAAGGGHLNTLKYLIEEKGINHQIRTSAGRRTTQFTMTSGKSLVHTASHNGHLQMVRSIMAVIHPVRMMKGTLHSTLPVIRDTWTLWLTWSVSCTVIITALVTMAGHVFMLQVGGADIMWLILITLVS